MIAIIGDVEGGGAQTECQGQSVVLTVLSYLILAGGLLTVVLALYLVITCYSSLPYWDTWSVVEAASNGTNLLSPKWLWQQHNEHRPLLPKVLLATDMALFQGRQWFLLASIFTTQVLHLALIAWSMRLLGGWRGVLWRSGVGLTAFCLFCPSQWENFTWGFQTCFVLPLLFATASFVALIVYWQACLQSPGKLHSRTALYLSILTAVAASLSLASGLLLWPILCGAAKYLRIRWRDFCLILSAGLICTGSYLYGYVQPLTHSNPISSIQHPVKMLFFSAEYLISPWLHRGMRAPEGLLLSLILIIVILLLVRLQGIGSFRPFAIQLILMTTFYLSTCLLTAAGRLNFASRQAAASRYESVALLFWCCMSLLILGSCFAVLTKGQMSFGFMQLLVVVVLVRGALLFGYPMADARARALRQEAVAAELLSGVYDNKTLCSTHPDPALIIRLVPFLKANRLSVFAETSNSERHCASQLR